MKKLKSMVFTCWFKPANPVCCGDLNTINSDFSHDAQLAATFASCAPLHGGLHVATYIHVPPPPSAHSTHGSFHVKSPNALNGSDPDFGENAYIWSLVPK